MRRSRYARTRPTDRCWHRLRADAEFAPAHRLALHQQRMLRLMTARRALGDATLALLPPDVRGGYAAQIYNIVIRGSHPGRPSHKPRTIPAA